MGNRLIRFNEDFIHTSFVVNGKSYVVFSDTDDAQEGDILIFGKLIYLEDGTKFITELTEKEYEEAARKYHELVSLLRKEENI